MTSNAECSVQQSGSAAVEAGSHRLGFHVQQAIAEQESTSIEQPWQASSCEMTLEASCELCVDSDDLLQVPDRALCLCRPQCQPAKGAWKNFTCLDVLVPCPDASECMQGFPHFPPGRPRGGVPLYGPGSRGTPISPQQQAHLQPAVVTQAARPQQQSALPLNTFVSASLLASSDRETCHLNAWC